MTQPRFGSRDLVIKHGPLTPLYSLPSQRWHKGLGFVSAGSVKVLGRSSSPPILSDLPLAKPLVSVTDNGTQSG